MGPPWCLWRRGRAVLLALLAVQMAIGLYQQSVFFREMFRYPSTLPGASLPHLLRGLWLPTAVLLAAALWARAATLAAAGLGLIAALGLAHYLAGLLLGRLIPLLTWVLLAAAIAGGIFSRRMGGRAAPPPPPRWSAWDGVSVFFLATLLVSAAFPYDIHYDTRVIWACRAKAMARTGSLLGLQDCLWQSHPYPPLWPLLLWTGITEPVFQGRLLAWVLVVLFVLFFRERLGRLEAALAGPALLFFVSTVNVWQGSAMYYANVPLMVFLSAGSLLVLGLPRGGAPGPSGAEIAAGTLCLSAATLVRPDGAYYLGVVTLAAGWFRLRGRGHIRLWPFLVGFAAGGTWLLRPAALRQTAGFFATGHGFWRLAAPTRGGAVLEIVLTFLNGWQGQWLSHNGLGAAFYLLAGLAAFRWLRAGPRPRPCGFHDAPFYGLVTGGFLVAVPLCYLLVPFLGDPRVACPGPGAAYLECYLSFIRLGLGRMTVHLYPLMILFGVATVRDLSDTASQPGDTRLS